MKGDVVYSPVAFNILSDQRLLKGNIRRELNTKEDAVVIIQASRMEPWKGHGILLLALSRLNDLSNWICWIAGGAQRPKELAYMNSLKKEAKRLGISDRVIFLGYRHDIPNLLCASDIFCQPNIRPEPFGISFIEALYANLPVVTSSVGGALEIINRSCGILVKPNDYNALSLSLRRLITDQAQRLELGGIGYTRANDLCNPDKQINKIYNLLSSLKR
jgi:glycosyltransferase involved in cell wall biosynthesis